MSIKLLKTKICLKFLLFKVSLEGYRVYFLTNTKTPSSSAPDNREH